VDQGHEEWRSVTKDFSHGANGAYEIVDIHERHLARCAVEWAPIPPRIWFSDVADLEVQRWSRCFGFYFRLGDHRLGEVKSKDMSTLTCEFPCGATGAAGDIEPPLTLEPLRKESARTLAD
jgi:hypothetical protein